LFSWGKNSGSPLLLIYQHGVLKMDKKFTDYTADDFIAEESFFNWATNHNNEKNGFWPQWIDRHPEKREEINLALSFIHNLRVKTDTPSKLQVDRSLQKNLAAIDTIERTRVKVKRSSLIYWMAAAVAVLAIAMTSVFLLKKTQVTIEMVAGSQEIKSIVLPDSSTVTLNAGSSITYGSNMKDAAYREVWLRGEAFFDVKHLKKKERTNRFIVHTDDMDIEVVGTTFNVKKLESVTNVSLNTGKIKISLKADPGTAIYLEPGDFVQYSAGEKHILKKQVKAELYSVWKEEKLLMDDVPLSEIATLIQDTYGYTVKIEDKQLANNKISGTLRLKDENTLLETLEFALGITILKQDSVLIFQNIAKPKN
jgi:transmembrane sensor